MNDLNSVFVEDTGFHARKQKCHVEGTILVRAFDPVAAMIYDSASSVLVGIPKSEVLLRVTAEWYEDREEEKKEEWTMIKGEKRIKKWRKKKLKH